MKHEKQCPHANTVQAGDDSEIRTYCTDCNELINVKKFIPAYNTLDSHGDVILPGAFDKSIASGKYIIKNHYAKN